MLDTFTHIHVPGNPQRPALLLLHGTGGNEYDLLELGQAVAPGATLLSLRGQVLEQGMPRFFRRLTEGVFDLADLRLRTDALADFIAAARETYAIHQPLLALGFSNGANIAASLLLSRPDAIHGALLLRAMVPYELKAMPNLSGKKVLLLSGAMDSIVPADNARRLAGMLNAAGAKVTFTLKPASHALVPSDVSEMRQWLDAG